MRLAFHVSLLSDWVTFCLRVRLFLFPCLLALCIWGCGGAESPPGTCLERLSIVSSKKLNNFSGLRLQLACVYDKKLLDRLKQMEAKAYFHNIDQLRRDNPKNLVVFHWELIPSQVLEDYTPTIPREDDVYGLLVFADYHHQGKHRLAIKEDVEHARIVLGDKGIKTIENVKDQPLTGKESLLVYPLESTLLLDSSMAVLDQESI